MSHFRYVRVRYEDLVSEYHTKEILDELYDFMKIPYDLEAQNTTLGYLMHGRSNESHGGYFDLSKRKEFDPNHWTKDLNGVVIEGCSDFVCTLFPKRHVSLLFQQIHHVEEWCGDVIQALGYPYPVCSML